MVQNKFFLFQMNITIKIDDFMQYAVMILLYSFYAWVEISVSAAFRERNSSFH